MASRILLGKSTYRHVFLILNIVTITMCSTVYSIPTILYFMMPLIILLDSAKIKKFVTKNEIVSRVKINKRMYLGEYIKVSLTLPLRA